jgi:glycosyltransferase involved in cell wall biosynthesis
MLHTFLGGRGRVAAIFNGVPEVDAATVRSLRQVKRRELGLCDRDFLVLGVGRLVEQKRPFAFLSLAKELRGYVPEAKFLWVGDGKLAADWQESVARLGLGGEVSCAGWQPDVQAYYSAADVLLHVAKFEGLPLAVVEAMASGLPCAVTRDLSSEVPFFTEENVLFVDCLDELAQKIRDPLTLARIGQEGRRLVEDRLSATKMAESYEQLYVRVATGSSHSGSVLPGWHKTKPVRSLLRGG